MTELMKKFKSYLERFDYPNINFLDNDQVADLFAPTNRKDMVIWLIQNLSSNIVLPAEWKSAENIIADYMYENGFCKSTQKHQFVTGDATLSPKDEITIFERIFEYLSIIKMENILPLTNITYNIESLINIDLNIFPKLGLPKLLSAVEKQQKINYYKLNIAELEKKIEQFNNSNSDIDVSCTTTIPEVNSTCEIDGEHFYSKALKVQEVASTLHKIVGTQTNEQLYGFDSKFGESLRSCTEETIEVVKYLKNLNIDLSCNEETVALFDTDDESEMYDLTMRNARLASDTIEILKTLK